MNAKTVLYVDDDENDVFFLKRAFQKAGILNPLHVACDGQEAIDFLAGNGKFADRDQYPMPYVLLLDLNLPKKPGLEVLCWIRQQPGFFTLPVVILSASNHEFDLYRAYASGANAYLVKPSGFREATDMARQFAEFWLVRNEPPPDCLRFKTEGTVRQSELAVV